MLGILRRAGSHHQLCGGRAVAEGVYGWAGEWFSFLFPLLAFLPFFLQRVTHGNGSVYAGICLHELTSPPLPFTYILLVYQLQALPTNIHTHKDSKSANYSPPLSARHAETTSKTKKHNQLPPVEAVSQDLGPAEETGQLGITLVSVREREGGGGRERVCV